MSTAEWYPAGARPLAYTDVYFLESLAFMGILILVLLGTWLHQRYRPGSRRG